MGFELMLPPPSMTKTSLGRFSLNQTPLRHEGAVDREESLMFAVFSFTGVWRTTTDFLALFLSSPNFKREIRIHALPSLEGMEYMYF